MPGKPVAFLTRRQFSSAKSYRICEREPDIAIQPVVAHTTIDQIASRLGIKRSTLAAFNQIAAAFGIDAVAPGTRHDPVPAFRAVLPIEHVCASRLRRVWIRHDVAQCVHGGVDLRGGWVLIDRGPIAINAKQVRSPDFLAQLDEEITFAPVLQQQAAAGRVNEADQKIGTLFRIREFAIGALPQVLIEFQAGIGDDTNGLL